MSSDEQALPPGWAKAYSNSNKKYYYFHQATDTKQWHFPTASEAKDPTIAKRRAEKAKEREYSKRPKIAATPDAALKLADTVSVAIIVPFRDLHEEQQRSAHLKQFVPHMVRFLASCPNVSDYHVYIIEQSSDGYKFNRGKLLNIGFDIAKKNRHDVYCFHDVDLLPQDDLRTAYGTFPRKPYHIARVWNRYSNNPKYFGGVVSFSAADFKRMNGVRDLHCVMVRSCVLV